MDIIGWLFDTSRSPTQASTSSATIGWACTVGWASHGVYTTYPCSTYAWGHLYCSFYHSCYSIGCTFYIWGLHHHFYHKISCHDTYILDTDHYTQCFIPEDGRHACSAGLTYCYPSLDSATSRTSATTSTWHSWTIRAHNSNWEDYSSLGDYSSEETTRADVPIQPTQEATIEPSSLPEAPATWSSLYSLVFTYYISKHNSLFWCFIFWDWKYYIIISHIVLSQSNIYTSFFIIFFIFLFPLLITLLFFWIMWFFLYISDSISLRRYHFLPLFTIALATLRAMLILVGGKS